MGLIDKGTETIVIFPSVESDDGYGTTVRVPAETGVTVERVLVLPVPVGEDASEGQSARPRFRVIARPIDVAGFDAFAEVEWRGARYDVVGLPITKTTIRSLANTTALLQERARVLDPVLTTGFGLDPFGLTPFGGA